MSSVTFFNGLVQDAQCDFIGRGLFDAIQHVAGFGVNDHAPGTLQKTMNAFNAVHRPRLGGLQRPHEHFIQPHRVGAILFNNIVGIDDIAAGLAHLLVVFPENHALIDELLIRLLCGDIAQIV